MSSVFSSIAPALTGKSSKGRGRRRHGRDGTKGTHGTTTSGRTQTRTGRGR